MPNVYVPNRSHHDFSDAEQWGDLVFLTDGHVNRYAISSLYRDIMAKMSDASADDYLIVGSLTIINVIATAIMIKRFGKVNLLLFCDNKYISKIVSMENLDT